MYSLIVKTQLTIQHPTIKDLVFVLYKLYKFRVPQGENGNEN